MAMIGLVPGSTGLGSSRLGGSQLGMAAAGLARAGRPARVTEALYCPPAVRDDPALAAAVQERLDDWGSGVGLAPGPAAGLGRLVVLAHPDTDDVGRLTVAARLLAVGRLLAGGALGADVGDLVQRAPEPDTAASSTGTGTGSGIAASTAAAAAIAAAAATSPETAETVQTAQAAQTAGHGATASALAQALDQAIAEVYDGCALPDAALPAKADPARAGIANPALLSAMAGLSALPASPYQVERVRRECQALSSAAPGRGGARPPWEYLSLGHINAYSPALAALDAVDGYELSPSASADPELRRAQRLAAFAAALLHDIADPAPSGLTAAIADTDGLGPGAAGRRAAEIHDEAMRAFQHHATHLAASADPATRRYLGGLWTWLGGHRTWHAVS
ncbi:hypothetical protein KGQ20_16535 [Catenulispora sp. NF23]|uniref:hypothetical protein n=1 Tax=Catenulispora pinistramenti TaxID=2705254 RepID=UPI001BA52F9A|nr:hypothetical protein [Catenulispora pinistramenti]MBS2534379.1 hypothetical protein [Catenulispora pinistramenti]